MQMKNTVKLFATAALLAGFVGSAQAAPILGTTTYTGYDASSPFASTFGPLLSLNGVGTPAETTAVDDFRGLASTVATNANYFFLEDLQDGQFDTPGATLTATHVRTGDGINGSTASGFSDNVAEDTLRTSSIRSFPTVFRVNFSAVALGGNLPTFVGVVQVEQSNTRTLTAYDSNGDEIETATILSANTVDDQFIGLSTTTGIAYVTSTGDVEYDHFQYGYVVPEPSSLALLGLGGLMMIKRRRRG